MSNEYHIIKEHRYRKLVRDALWLGRKRKYISEYIEMDITNVRKNIREYRRTNNTSLSLNAYFIKVISRCLKKYPIMNSHRLFGGSIAQFNKIDTFYPIELKENGELVLAATLFRNTDEVHITKIHDKLESLKNGNSNIFTKEEEFIISLPKIFRRLLYRIVWLFPKLYQRVFGSIMISSYINTASENIWATGLPFHSLAIYIGPVFKKYIPSNNEEKIFVSFSFCYDHDIVDGAIGTRFMQYLFDEIKKGNIE